MGSARQFVEVLSRLVECEPGAEGAGLRSKSNKSGQNFSKKSKQKTVEPGTSEGFLARTIEAEIIPRLMMSHRLGQGHSLTAPRKIRAVGDLDVVEFARLVVLHDVMVAEAYIQVFREQGISLENIFMQLLAPAAKHLGDMWLSDACSFTDVTVGLSRIYQLVHRLSPVFESEAGATRSSCGRTAFLAPVPGEQHGLGLLLVEEFFRREGWDVWAPSAVTGAEIIKAASQEHYDVIGISVTCGALLDDLASVIQSARTQSRNPNVVVMVGGRFINDNPGLVKRLGADATDYDGSQAVRQIDACARRLNNGR